MRNKGFTLMEILIVIGVLIVLSMIIVTAVNPGRVVINARDNQRRIHAQTIYAAFEHYIYQNIKFPDCLGDIEKDVIECEYVLVPVYLSSIPKDPICGSDLQSGYDVRINNIGEWGVRAYCKEGDEPIIVGMWEDYF